MPAGQGEPALRHLIITVRQAAVASRMLG